MLALAADVPSGLATVAVVVDAEDVPSGFAAVALCVGIVEVVAAGFAVAVVAGVAAGVPSGLDTVAPWLAEEGALAGATVADKTFAVMFAEPAELGFDPDAGALLTRAVPDAVATAWVVEVPAALEFDSTAALVPLGVVVVVVAGAAGLPLPAGAMLTATDAGALLFVAAAGLLAAVVCTVSAGDEGLELGFTLPGAPAAFCAAGTVPAPGVPIPGNTVPCCRLPSFGRVAGGVEIAAAAGGCVAAAACFSGKLIGGNFGGTGIGAGAAAVSVVAV